MGNIEAKIKNINDLHYDSMCIPDFQRPYVWSVKNIAQLWNDIIISYEQEKKEYRIGTIILYRNQTENTLEIVDGQQRITSLCLILQLLQPTDIKFSFHSFLHKKQYNHSISKKCIKENQLELNELINDYNNKTDIFYYIQKKCTVVEITVSSISEAFQMFDSQNGTGLPLEPYNLLKAFHIRSFDSHTNNIILDENKIKCDRDWEEAAKNNKRDYLKQLINEQLFRTRKWSRREEAYQFDKTQIGEFKGITRGALHYAFENYATILSDNPSQEGRIKRYENDTLQSVNQIYQTIINGRSFFDYVQYYISCYKALFEEEKLTELVNFRTFYNEYSAYKTNRIGDKYLHELYKSMIMLVFDMFGTQGINRYYKLIFAYVYRFRIEKKFVKYNSVAQFPKNTIAKIRNAKELIELNFIKELALAPIQRGRNNSNHIKLENYLSKELNIKIQE
ncbi:MAG: DUF262 domain-containing protein [Bacteroidetes bacterium]|nr:DUF262 domain-containing protein [Bacteroidota bacterium]